MAIYLVYFVLIILAIDCTAGSPKYPYIGECYYEGNGSVEKVTFICTETVQTKNFFDTNARAKCKNQNYYSDGFLKILITRIDFQYCELAQLQNNLFNGYGGIVTLNISDLNLRSADTFTGASKLFTLFASHNQITEIPANLFNHTGQISSVDFSFNQISRIDSNAFLIGNQLQHLNLSSNKISELDVGLFQKFNRLITLSLSHNSIEEIPQFLFHKTDQLIEIDFSFNQIRKIDDFAFFGDFKLNKLNLSHNQLTTLSKQILDNHSNLKTLDISWNRLMVLTSDSFVNLRNMVHLNLSQNSIRKLENGTFANLLKLQSLDLSHNKLIVLDINTLPSRPFLLERLSIGHNRLRQLYEFNGSHIPNAKIAGIESNRFDCLSLNKLFQTITWKHLVLNANGFNCSQQSEQSTDEDPEESDGNQIPQQNGLEMKADNLTMDHNRSQRDAASKTYLIWFNVIGLSIIVLVLVLILLHMQMQMDGEKKFSEVFYRKK